MNSIILLLKSADKDQSIFKADIPTGSQVCREYLFAAAKTVNAVEEEDANLIYDEQAFNAIIGNISDDSYPNIALLREYFNNFVDFRCAENFIETELTIAGIKYKNIILGAVLYGRDYVCCIVDHDAILPDIRYHIEHCDDLNGADFTVLPCTGMDIHKWFVENRLPQRNYDFEYDKHHKDERQVDGEIISSQPYDRERIVSFLRNAIGLNGEKRRYYKISDKFIAVFCDENLNIPTYHGYVVKTSNQKEMSKIRRGNLDKKLEALR